MQTELLQPQGDAEQVLINAVRAERGLPRGEKIAVCQHSCAAADIPGCTAFNCEAAWICDPDDVEAVRNAVAIGQTTAFAAVPVQIATAYHSALAERALATGLQVTVQAPMMTLAGNLLQVTRLTLESELPAEALAHLQEVEQLLVQQFCSGGACLVQERHCDLRHFPELRGSLVALYGRNAWPAHAVAAWERPAPRLPLLPTVNQGYGLEMQPGRGYVLGPLRYGLQQRPGDLYGPTVRLQFRVDDAVADAVRTLFPTTTEPVDQPDATFLGRLRQVAEVLQLPQPAAPEYVEGLQSAHWLQALRKCLPLA